MGEKGDRHDAVHLLTGLHTSLIQKMGYLTLCGSAAAPWSRGITRLPYRQLLKHHTVSLSKDSIPSQTLPQAKNHPIMKFILLHLLILYTLTLTTQATPPTTPLPLHLTKRHNPTYICEVSTGSPPNRHALLAAERLTTRNGLQWCVVKNPRRSKCTEMIYAGSAALAICGDKKNAGIRCGEVAKAVQELSRRCARRVDDTVRLGGKVVFEWGEVIVIRKKSITVPIPYGFPLDLGALQTAREWYEPED